MGSTIATIIGAVVTSSAIIGFIQFLISRKDTRNDVLKEIKDKLKEQERDILRTQLLLLILLQPKEQQEILTIAERYFAKPPAGLGGNWYMTSIFNKWLLNADIAKPEWFDSDK